MRVRPNSLLSPVKQAGIERSGSGPPLGKLTDRQRRERELYDQWAKELRPEELQVEPSFAASTAPENRFILGFLGPLEGKNILDLGAGPGETSLFFAQRGARVTAVDISAGQLEILSRAANARGLEIETWAVPAEELPFRDGTFHIVYANSALHHMDYRRVVAEARRVLRPHGKVAFVEPLAYNPVIRIYRRMSATFHTPDEQPLTMPDVSWIMGQFPRASHHEFWISALGVFLCFWLVEQGATDAGTLLEEGHP